MSAKKKCCCNACENNTGCDTAHTLCTGLRFLLPHLDDVAVTGGESIDESDEPGIDPYVYYETDGTYAGNTYTGAPNVYDPAPRAVHTYSVSFAEVDHAAFASAEEDATYEGYYLNITIDGETQTFDGTAGTGVSFSTGIAPYAAGVGTWSTGTSATTAFGVTTTFNIDSYSYTMNIGATVAEYEAIYFKVYRTKTGSTFSYRVDYIIERAMHFGASIEREHVQKRRREKTTSPTFDEIQYTVPSRAVLAANRLSFVAKGTAEGTSGTVTDICDGTQGSITVANTEHGFASEVSGSPKIVPKRDSATSGWVWPTVVTPTDSSWATGTPPAGTATMSLDTGDWTEPEVGCRNCPYYLDISGVLTPIDFGGVSATLTGRVVLNAVAQCEWYECEWGTNGTTATASVTYSDTGSSSASITLRRVGPSLWYMSITMSRANVRILLKFDGDCPLGTATVCPCLTENVQIGLDGEDDVQAIHRYGQRAQLNGGGTAYEYEDYDEWEDDPGYQDHTATAGDLGTIVVDPSDYGDYLTTHSLTFTQGERVTGDPTYYCSEYVLWNTGEDVTGGEDQRWEVEDGNGSGVFIPAPVIASPSGFYATPGPEAGWIGIDTLGSGYAGIRLYRTTVTINGTPDRDLEGTISSDNQCLSISANSTVVATNVTPADNEFGVKTPFTIPVANLITGANVIEFEIEDEDDVAGLLVEWTSP